MKKIMILFMALTTFAMTAQNNNADKKQPRDGNRTDFTPEQRAELHTKRMALELDLNESQQKKVQQLFLDMAKNKPERADRKEMTDQQKFEAKNAMLDRRIALKKQLKEILTEAQFAKWEKGKRVEKRGYPRHKSKSERKQGK